MHPQSSNPQPPLIGRLFASLGASVFGTIAFVLLVILLAPVILLLLLWTLFMQWRFKKKFQKMAAEMEASLREGGSCSPPDAAETKKVDVTVYPSDADGGGEFAGPAPEKKQ